MRRWSTFAAIVFGLFASAALAGPPDLVLVGGGGKTRKDAERWKASLDDDRGRDALVRDVTFGPGFPRIVESAQVKGLRPGLHVVLLGFCPGELAAARLAGLKRAISGAYGRPTTEKIAAADCPALAAFPPAGIKVERTETVAGGEGLLKAWFLAVGIDQYNHSSAAVITLEDGKGRLLDAWRAPPVGDPTPGPGGDEMKPTCRPYLRSTGDGRSLFVEQSCARQVNGGGAFCSVTTTAAIELGIAPGPVLKVTTEKPEVGDMKCWGE